MANHLFIRNLNRCGQQISIMNRQLSESDFSSMQPTEIFTEVDIPLAIVKTLGKGDKLFDSVQIVDGATHLFCLLYDPVLSGIEFQNHFIDLKTERYKILAVSNIDEKDEMLAIQAVKRGKITDEAASA